MAASGPARWQEAWRAAGLASASRRAGRRKFYALNAYPGPSGFLHAGHLRGYAYLDVLARYHRMLGEEVFLPFGIHASGLPAVAWAQKLRDGDTTVLRQLDQAGVDAAERRRLEEPEEVARFFARNYRDVLERFGVLVDRASVLTTIDDDYRAFVRWQMRALAARGAVGQGTHYASVCPVCGPVAVDAAETDLAEGGDAEVVAFTTVPFVLEDGRILLAATLRPETVFGVTNLWLPPGGHLLAWHHRDLVFLVGPAAAERLVEQHGGKVGHSVDVSELLGREARAPLTGHHVPVLASPVVDPAIGTGVVMSVPAHAPADAAALREFGEAERSRPLAPRVLLEVGPELSGSEGELLRGHGTPAERALNAVGVRGLSDRDRLDEATERLYRLEYVRGRMTVPELAGVTVRAARERVAAQLEATGTSFPLRAFSKPVVCRNGHAVVIRRVADQWFLRYSDPAWKATTVASLAELTVVPEEYARELPAIIDWFEDRPCTRRGRWLGSPFALDPSWTVEPIADSTFYMAYFVVRRFVASGQLATSQLTDAFFDHVFLGEGPGEPSVPEPLRSAVREEFLYWYPLDLNIGGKEHRRVHFPVFLYTHAKLLPPSLRPRGLLAHGWITGPAGEKVSKKEVGTKGGRIPPIDEAFERWGPDALRLFYLLASSSAQDLAFDGALVDAAVARLEEVGRLVRGARGDGDGPPELDAWLDSRMHELVGRVRACYAAADLRTAAEATCVELPSLLRRYYARGGSAGAATDRLARAWIRLLAPVSPHLAEELGEGSFSGLVAVQPFPAAEEFARSEAAERREEYLERVEEDLRAVLRPREERGEPVPGELLFFVAAPWKREVERWMRESVERGEEPTVRGIMERAAAHASVASFRAEIPRYVQRFGPSVRGETPVEPPPDELEQLRAVEGYLVRRLGLRSVAVYAEEESAPHDPQRRRERARPGRPAFYFLGAPEGPAPVPRPSAAGTGGAGSPRSRP
ncbi:MAG TPA: class I tRNA ligase family protein [Thermoplasmata archaeon]|nr:class I tRNA ligase family protein [Thermoplasmata archaeon]